MIKLISNIFVNITIMVSLITFANQLYRDVDSKISSKLFKIVIAGVLAGIIGIVSMIYSIHTVKGFIIDFPHMAVILSAIYFSFPTAIVATVIIHTFAIFLFGFEPHSIASFIIGFIDAIGCSIIGKLSIKRWQKWLVSYLYVCVVFLLISLIILQPPSNFIEMIFVYYLGTALISLVLYYFMEYIILTNKTYYEMKEAANKDYLTGLNNVRQYDKFLNDALKKSREKNENLSVLFLDIDHFKKINDSYGHLEGDKILKKLSVLLRENSRPEDIISRNGGEEFSILLRCSLGHAIEVAERIRKTVEEHSFVIGTGEIITVTVSIGISSFPNTTNEINKLVEQSDNALYEAKKTGRNRIVVAG